MIYLVVGLLVLFALATLLRMAVEPACPACRTRAPRSASVCPACGRFLR